MKGIEVRKILSDHKVNLTWLAEQLGIKPQALNSRLNAQVFKSSYLLEITQILKKDYFGTQGSDSIPILDMRIGSDSGTSLEASSSRVVEYVNIPAFEGCLGIAIYGDSMAPDYLPGDVLFVRPINRLEHIDYGQCFILITPNDRLLKRVTPSENESSLHLSDASSLSYDLSFSDILFLYKVCGVLRRYQI